MRRDIDALIAEYVMELKPCTDPAGKCEAAHMTPPQCWGTGKGGSDLELYSFDISAAWQVVEHLHGRVVIDHWFPGEYKVMVYIPSSGRPSVEVTADTAPLAICLAALKALGIEVPSE